MATLTVFASTYNRAANLDAVVEAVAQQSRQPDEFLITDDGSTDGSWEVLTAWAAKYPLLTLIRNQPNRGAIYSYRQLLERATGDFFLSTASDDLILPGTLEAGMRVAEAYPQAAMVCGRSVWWNEATDDQFTTGLAMPDQECFISPEECVALAKRGCLDIGTHATLFHRQRLWDCGSFRPEHDWHMDWFATYVLAFRHGIAWTPHPMAVMRLHSGSYSHISKHPPAERKKVYAAMAETLLEPEMADVRPGFNRSGVMSYYQWLMFSVLLGRPRYWRLISPAFLLSLLRAALRSSKTIRELVRRFRPVPPRIAHTEIDLSAMQARK